jgi:tetrapyrrole methylase family protein/MazG family protein
LAGLGPGNYESLTIGTLKLLKAGPLFLRTREHPTVGFLESEGIAFESLDRFYETLDSFEEVYSSIAEFIVTEAVKGDVVYAVPGHPLVAEKSVQLIMEAAKENGIAFRIHPAVSFVDAVTEALGIDPIAGLRIIDALDIENEHPDFSKGTVITQVYSPYVAGRVKLALSQYMEDEAEIVFIRAAGTADESIRKIMLYELDRQKDIDHLTSVYVPKDNLAYDFYSYLRIVERLRGEDGCPWDKEQTHDSLKRYLIEEAYETLEAIDLDDPDLMSEELGDVLLQVLLHSVIGRQSGEFNIHEVIRLGSEKMIYRHPHVFDKDKDMTSDEVLVQWDELKKKEKNEGSIIDAVSSVSRHYPSLLRAEKVQRKARKYGFDWDDIEPVFAKISEEILEVREALDEGNGNDAKKELGDLLFAVVNLSRFIDADPEISLNNTTDRFISRISKMEELISADGVTFKGLGLEELDRYWEKAKIFEKNR